MNTFAKWVQQELTRRKSRHQIAVKAAIASDLGISHSLLNHYEKGRSVPSLTKALEIEERTNGAVKVADWKRNTVQQEK